VEPRACSIPVSPPLGASHAGKLLQLFNLYGFSMISGGYGYHGKKTVRGFMKSETDITLFVKPVALLGALLRYVA
jgi:hypothetical protein